jgi:hypothetical protein
MERGIKKFGNMIKQKETGRIRNYKTLTTEELIAMADHLVCFSKPVTKYGDMYYRKIEARLHPNINGLICRPLFSKLAGKTFV